MGVDCFLAILTNGKQCNVALHKSLFLKSLYFRKQLMANGGIKSEEGKNEEWRLADIVRELLFF